MHEHNPLGDATTLSWQAADGSTWRIDLKPGAIVLSGEGETDTLSTERWTRDLYIAPHGNGYIVRIETRTRSVGFIVSGEQAAPLLRHVREHLAPTLTAEPSEASQPPPPSRDALLWPRVSPLAVWALITSSLVFLPVIGVIPAVVTAVLLVLHRMRVRRSDAYRHSRALCATAFVLATCGLIVSALSTWGLITNLEFDDDIAPLELESASLSWGAAATQAGPLYDEVASGEEPALAGFLDSEHNWPLIVAGLLAVLFSLTVHEAAHAISAWWLGDDLARRLGRVTLNPLAHIDPIGTVVLPLILFLSGVGVFGWARPVPVRVENLPRPRRAHILIAVAGPGSNLLQAAASLMLLMGVGCLVRLLAPQGTLENFATIDFDSTVQARGFMLAPMVGPLCTILQMSFLVNVFLAFFNLIPIPPLDGSWVLEHMFPRTLGPIYQRIRPFAFLLFLGLIYSDLLVYLIAPALIVIGAGFGMLHLCTGFM